MDETPEERATRRAVEARTASLRFDAETRAATEGPPATAVFYGPDGLCPETGEPIESCPAAHDHLQSLPLSDEDAAVVASWAADG